MLILLPSPRRETPIHQVYGCVPPTRVDFWTSKIHNWPQFSNYHSYSRTGSPFDPLGFITTLTPSNRKKQTKTKKKLVKIEKQRKVNFHKQYIELLHFSKVLKTLQKLINLQGHLNVSILPIRISFKKIINLKKKGWSFFTTLEVCKN